MAEAFAWGEVIHHAPGSVVMRGVRRSDGARVVLKALGSRHAARDRLADFLRERQMTRRAQGPGAVALLAEVEHEGRPAMVLEDFGAPLPTAPGALTAGERMAVALDLARAVAALHARGIIHKDINPSNALWDRATGAVKLIDFGLATDLRREEPTRRVEGTLRYLAPEQTGRMRAGVDARSDLYALGATLYELFAGRAPFEAEAPLELVHAHLARAPEPLCAVAPGTPDAVGRVVARLLEKAPERRYQTAAGVVHDLERCASGDEGFALGLGDRGVAFAAPQRLYGRAEELRALTDSFARVAGGSTEVALVTGAPGIGKTALVRELERVAADRGGALLEGKFDQFRLGVPYAPLGRAFGPLLRRVLTLDDEGVAAWRARVGAALGRNGGVVREILPEIEALLGPQEDAPRLAAAEAENRFHLVFRELVHALARAEHPLVLFLDDLQWADVPTLRLFERLATDVEARHLMIVGAWRDAEVDAAHPLALSVAAIRRAGVAPTVLELGPLAGGDVEALLRDALGEADPPVAALAEVCLARTGGNPFFLSRFVESLAEHGHLAWDVAARRWTWDPRRVAALPHTENVVAFLIAGMAELPAPARLALQRAACVGDTFDLRLLAELAAETPGAVQADLRPAAEAGLVAPLGASWALGGDDPADLPDEAWRWRFAHDRVQQAAYRSMDPAEVRETHRRLGWMFARRREGAWRFEVVKHLNLAAELVTDPAERVMLARMNLDAGRQALRAAAFGPAAEFFEAGLGALRADAWESDYELALGLHVDAAEAAYLTAAFERVAALLDVVKARARTLLDRVKALEVDMEARMARDDFRGALDVALDALDRLGVSFPREPTGDDVGGAVRRAVEAIDGLSQDAIARLPDVDDPAVAAAQRIMLRSGSISYYVAPAMLPLIAAELVVTSVRRGPSVATPFGFAILGIVLNAAGMMDRAFACGELALRLIDRWEDRRLEARTRLVVNNHVCTWIAPLDGRLDALRDAYRIGRDHGDFEYAAIAGQCYATNAFTAGRELGPLIAEAEAWAGFMRNYAQRSILRLHLPLLQLARAFAGGLADPARLDGPDLDEAEAAAFARASNSASLAFVTLSDMLIARYHFGDADEAWALAEEARPHQHGAASTYHLANFHTYAPLAAARVAERAVGGDRDALLARIDESLAQLRAWAAAGPVNHAHRVALVEAERARVDGAPELAAERYVAALDAARRTHYVNDEALIAERAARFHLARGGAHATVARAFLEDALFAYERWGAAKKVERLAEEFARLLGATSGRSRGARATHGGSGGVDIDAEAVVRAARAISAEIEVDRLLATLFRTSVEAAGAARAMLLLDRGGRWEVAVEGRAAEAPRLSDAPLGSLDPARYPLAVLRYVLRTGEVVVIDDAARPGTLASDDAYVRARGVRSVLCLPVRHRGAVAAVLYLDHDGAAGVFTAERSELMQVLTAQAAVSLHNAQLYEAQVRLTRAQSRFVPHQFLESLDRRDIAEVALGDAVSRTMSVLFSDLREFTTLVERSDARAMVRLLNEYFAAMEPAITAGGGFIDSFNGDGIMALFDVAPERAVRAGVAMHAALDAFNATRAAPLRMGVGVDTGPVVLGTVGGRDRIKCGVVGDAVNVASRVEGLTKRYGARLLIGEATREALPLGAFSLRPVDRVAVKGRTRAQTLYEVLDAAAPEPRAARERTREALAEAMARYYAGDFAAAARGFAACAEAAPDDPVPTIFAARCARFADAPPPPDWDGVDRLT